MIKFKLKEYLDGQKISVRSLAIQTGIRYDTLRKIANGEVEKINLDYLYQIMVALNISDMNVLMERVDN